MDAWDANVRPLMIRFGRLSVQRNSSLLSSIHQDPTGTDSCPRDKTWESDIVWRRTASSPATNPSTFATRTEGTPPLPSPSCPGPPGPCKLCQRYPLPNYPASFLVKACSQSQESWNASNGNIRAEELSICCGSVSELVGVIGDPSVTHCLVLNDAHPMHRTRNGLSTCLTCPQCLTT